MSGTGEPNRELNPSGTGTQPNPPQQPSGTDTAAEIAALKAEISDLRKETANYRTKAKGKETVKAACRKLRSVLPSLEFLIFGYTSN